MGPGGSERANSHPALTAEPTSGTQVMRPGLGGVWLRCLTWWRAVDLDSRLAGGADPIRSDALRLRVGQLGSAGSGRALLARCAGRSSWPTGHLIHQHGAARLGGCVGPNGCRAQCLGPASTTCSVSNGNHDSAGRRALNDTLGIAEQAGVPASAEQLDGKPARRVVEFARARDARLAVLGSRRRPLVRSVARCHPQRRPPGPRSRPRNAGRRLTRGGFGPGVRNGGPPSAGPVLTPIAA
jgi:nucleotide-binding universal stress UspA family protein